MITFDLGLLVFRSHPGSLSKAGSRVDLRYDVAVCCVGSIFTAAAQCLGLRTGIVALSGCLEVVESIFGNKEGLSSGGKSSCWPLLSGRGSFQQRGVSCNLVCVVSYLRRHNLSFALCSGIAPNTKWRYMHLYREREITGRALRANLRKRRQRQSEVSDIEGVSEMSYNRCLVFVLRFLCYILPPCLGIKQFT
jgi:hypothetical protein